MSVKTYAGSCHCGKIKFEADLDLSKGTSRCNCSFCGKTRNWSAIAKPQNFRLLSGKDFIGDYQFNSESPNHHFFCKNCGVRYSSKGFVEEIGGDYVSVVIAALDNITEQEKAALEITYMDGKNNNWFNKPEVTKHL